MNAVMAGKRHEHMQIGSRIAPFSGHCYRESIQVGHVVGHAVDDERRMRFR